METRILKYFLTIAKTKNITQAAQKLHITQPTLSRQIKQLENELHTTLFIRGKREIQLTAQGRILERKANDILTMINQTKEEISLFDNHELSGFINLGYVESHVAQFVDELIAQFQAKYPLIRFNTYSADGDDIKEKIDSGLLDLGFLIEPVEAAKYHLIKIPIYERWGIFVNHNHPLASKQTINAEDLNDYPMIFPRRSLVQNELTSVIGINPEKINIKLTINLSANAFYFIEKYNYCMLGIDGISYLNSSPEICFIPFENYFQTGHMLAWRKNKRYSKAVQTFIEFTKQQLTHLN